jgi:hypothetical protein
MRSGEDIGEFWPKGKTLSEVVTEFAHLPLFKDRGERLVGLSQPVAKQRVARALSVWMAERSEEPPAGLALKPKEIALVLYLASEVASERQAILPDELTLFLEDQAFDPITADTARRLRTKACEKIARYLLEPQLVDPTPSAATSRDGHSEGLQFDRSQTRLAREDQREAGVSHKDSLTTFTTALSQYCSDVPSWFPDRLGFAEMKQQVSVTPPRVKGGASPQRDPTSADEGSHSETSELESGASARRLSLDAALRQYQRLVVVGDPGTGKSWATRGIALTLIETIGADSNNAMLPLLILAPRLDEALQGIDLTNLSATDLAPLLVRGMPLPVVSRLAADQREFLVERILSGRPIALLIDGYDEIRSRHPVLNQALPALEAFCMQTTSWFVLTTRPSAVPSRVTTAFGWCTLEPFASREQWLFLERWFVDDRALARRLNGWVREHNREVMRSPLMLSLFCSVVEQGGQPPASEHELWERALLRLATEEERFGEIGQVAEQTRLRLSIAQAIAGCFVADSLAEAVGVSEIESQLRSSADWEALARLSAPTSVIDDLISTGIIAKSINGVSTEIGFLHSSIRDYLIARSLAPKDDWYSRIQLIWSHPEWEPVIGYLGALVEDPGELLAQLTARFATDPLNIARLVAGRALSAAPSAAVPANLAQRIRDELIVLLTSDDVLDRVRAAALLPVIGVADTTELLQRLLNPAVPTPVIASAISALAGNLSAPVQDKLSSLVKTEYFTGAEREAAVEAIADAGTDEALSRLEAFARDDSLPPHVRVAAAMAAWKSFDEEGAAIDIFAEGSAPAVQRVLSERLVADTDRAVVLSQRLQEGSLRLEDAYSRAVLLAGSRTAVGEEVDVAILASLPTNPALDVLKTAAESAFQRIDSEPLYATLLRFMRSSASSRLRWRVAERIATRPEAKALEMWTSLIDAATPTDAGVMAEFLAIEYDSAPEPLRTVVVDALSTTGAPPIVSHAIRRRQEAHREPNDSTLSQAGRDSSASPSDSSDLQSEVPLPNTLEGVLRADLPDLLRYGLVRVLRSQLPDAGRQRDEVSTLTHQVTVSGACTWIDAVPAVAPVLEARLLAAADPDRSLVELARLRARWPGRGSEVAHSSSALDARLLDAGAEAAIAEGDLSSASMLALASLGASSIDDHQPSRAAISVLFASGHATGRAVSTWKQIRSYLGTLRPGSLDQTLLASWIDAGHHLSAVGQRLSSLPGYIRASDPEVAALLLAAGITELSALEAVISWSGCRRAHALLLAARGYAASDAIKSALERASLALDERASSLSAGWPEVVLDSPSQAGKPRVHWSLVTIGSKLLIEGRPTAAVAVFETAVEELPSDPELRNNLGFCRLAIDTVAALDDLNEAKRLFGKPFNVNTANRMLAYFRQSDYRTVIELGDEVFQQGQYQGKAILWDIDDPQVLRHDVDVMLYIIELAERACHMERADDEASKWLKRRASWALRGAEDNIDA